MFFDNSVGIHMILFFKPSSQSFSIHGLECTSALSNAYSYPLLETKITGYLNSSYYYDPLPKLRGIRTVNATKYS